MVASFGRHQEEEYTFHKPWVEVVEYEESKPLGSFQSPPREKLLLTQSFYLTIDPPPPSVVWRPTVTAENGKLDGY